MGVALGLPPTRARLIVPGLAAVMGCELTAGPTGLSLALAAGLADAEAGVELAGLAAAELAVAALADGLAGVLRAGTEAAPPQAVSKRQIPANAAIVECFMALNGRLPGFFTWRTAW